MYLRFPSSSLFSLIPTLQLPRNRTYPHPFTSHGAKPLFAFTVPVSLAQIRKFMFAAVLDGEAGNLYREPFHSEVHVKLLKSFVKLPGNRTVCLRYRIVKRMHTE
jgi:hypothetical protein